MRMVKRAIQKVRPYILASRMKDVFEVDCSEALRRCEVPILYLAAARDALVRRSSVERILAIRSDVQIRMIDAPHLLLQREPAAAWKEIAQFLLKNGFNQTSLRNEIIGESVACIHRWTYPFFHRFS